MSAQFMSLVSDAWDRNRSLSVRSRKDGGSEKSSGKHRFSMASLRGVKQPELSKKLYRLIKAENHAISAYEAAAKEQAHIASQLSDWGEETGDDAISDVSDKLGVLLSEIAEQEDTLAAGLEDSRGVLKQIRDTEASVQPSRDHKTKISDEIQKLKYKEPSSTKIVTLEQELVRAEAQSLVAEAQLTNITRQKFKEAYDLHTAAIIERAEKQILLAKHARDLLNLVDDTPMIPGEAHPTFDHVETGRDILNQAEQELREWTPSVERIHTNASGLGPNAMPESSGRFSPVSTQASTMHEYSGSHETAHDAVPETIHETAHETAHEPVTHQSVNQHEPIPFEPVSQHEAGIAVTNPPYPAGEENTTHHVAA